MSRANSRIVLDCRWFLLLVLSGLVSLHAFVGGIISPYLGGDVTRNTASVWREFGLRWDSHGPDGAGIYGNVTGQLGRSAENLCLVSPRLAIFSFRPFDLNQIDVDTLQVVKGIGPKLATAIIDYRLAHGEFRTVGELLAVKGIGPVKLTALRSHLVVCPMPTP